MTTVPNPSTALAAVLVDELARNGVRHVVFAPGSRSAALVLAAASDGRLVLHRHLDERSASFFALGIGRASGNPAVVVTTSGTAVANLFPAVVEASMAGVPMLLLTADRPSELRDVGANQTIDQVRIFGRYPRWFSEIGAAEDRPESNALWRSTVCRAITESRGVSGIAGPVHLNAAFREPLVPSSDDGRASADPFVADIEGRPGGLPWTERVVERQAANAIPRRWIEKERGLVVAGSPTGRSRLDDVADRLAARLGWPLVAEPVSGGRPAQAISTAHHLVSHEGFARRHIPEAIVVLGRVGLSRAVARLVSSTPHLVVDPSGWMDPDRGAVAILGGLADDLPAVARSGSWRRDWLDAERVAREALDAAIDRVEVVSEPRVARDVARAVPGDGVLVAASSMPVRDLDLFMEPGRATVISNRGASGIDGFPSTVLGVAAESGRPVVAYAGDLSMLHDSNGLLVDPRPDAVFVVVDNDGGGIFSFLPQAGFPEHFERLFGARHGRSFERMGAFHDANVREVSAPGGLVHAVEEAHRDGGVQLVVVRTDRDANVGVHRSLTAAVHGELDRHLSA